MISGFTTRLDGAVSCISALLAFIQITVPVAAQFGGGPPATPVPIPSLDQLKATPQLTEEQMAQLTPLLAKAAANQKQIADLQASLGKLNLGLPEKLGPILTDEQREKLPQALFGARFGRGPGGFGPRATVPADQPSPRTDENSRKAHEQLLAKRKQGKIDLYFLGDSITRRWGATDYPELLAHWQKTFHGWNAANFGWGADTLQNMLWRLDNGELDDVNPKVIVFLGGTNNIGDRPGDDAKAADIARGTKAVLGRLQQKAPHATILLTGILPRGTDPQLHAFIKKINATVATYAEGKKVRYFDAFPRFVDSDGRLTAGAFTSDNLHLALDGYQLWADLLTPVLTQLLGLKAPDDHAPPPTGDPSAAGR
jgi:lysophospholipase L1-like esterase